MGGLILGNRRKRRKKTLKKRLHEKALWFTVFCLVISVIALVGIIWIIGDTYSYRYTIRTVEGTFDYYEEVKDKSYSPGGFVHTETQRNIYIDEKKYVIAGDSLNDFDVEIFLKNVAPGDKIVVQVTDDNIIYALEDSNKIQYLSLPEAQVNAKRDNIIGIVLCTILPILIWLVWYESDYGDK